MPLDDKTSAPASGGNAVSVFSVAVIPGAKMVWVGPVWKQWAAVMIHVGVMSEPPHR